jgi:hypothetical protein
MIETANGGVAAGLFATRGWGRVVPSLAALVAVLAFSSCAQGIPAHLEAAPVGLVRTKPAHTGPEYIVAGADPRASTWQVVGGSEGAAAILLLPDGRTALTLTCEMGRAELVVKVPGLALISSEDRLSLGFSDDGPIALAVDLQFAGPGIRAIGRSSEEVAARILSAESIGIAYGRFVLGPFAPPSSTEKATLARACSPRNAAGD